MHDISPLLIAIIGGIVLATILGLLANRLRISPLVGYLIAGIIFGSTTPGITADTVLTTATAVTLKNQNSPKIDISINTNFPSGNGSPIE